VLKNIQVQLRPIFCEMVLPAAVFRMIPSFIMVPHAQEVLSYFGPGGLYPKFSSTLRGGFGFFRSVSTGNESEFARPLRARRLG
jgi:hypothetical protein